MQQSTMRHGQLVYFKYPDFTLYGNATNIIYFLMSSPIYMDLRILPTAVTNTSGCRGWEAREAWFYYPHDLSGDFRIWGAREVLKSIYTTQITVATGI